MSEAICTLGMSEEWFWDSELRIVWNLINERQKTEAIKMKSQAVYIASYVWGKDPDKEEKKEIEGIDKPVSAEALRSFYM